MNLPTLTQRRTLETGNRLDGRCIASRYGGKSGLHRTGRQVTPGRRKPTDSATENKPPTLSSREPARVKRCGKSAPRGWQQARHGKPRPEQDQIEEH